MTITGKCGHTWDGPLGYYGYTCPVCGDVTSIVRKEYVPQPLPQGYIEVPLEVARQHSDVLTRDWTGKWLTCTRVFYDHEYIQSFAIRGNNDKREG